MKALFFEHSCSIGTNLYSALVQCMSFSQAAWGRHLQKGRLYGRVALLAAIDFKALSIPVSNTDIVTPEKLTLVQTGPKWECHGRKRKKDLQRGQTFTNRSTPPLSALMPVAERGCCHGEG